VDGAVAGYDKALHTGAFERDGAEVLLILGDVMAEHVEQCLGLLRAQVDALKVVDLDLFRGLLLQRTEDEKEVPDGEPDLYAVGVGVAISVGLSECDSGVVGLRPACLPFHHSRSKFQRNGMWAVTQ